MTCTARKGLAEQTWLDPEAWTSLCVFTLNAEGTITTLSCTPVPPASAAGVTVTNGAFLRLKALSCHKEPAWFVFLHSQGAVCDGSHCTELSHPQLHVLCSQSAVSRTGQSGSFLALSVAHRMCHSLQL